MGDQGTNLLIPLKTKWYKKRVNFSTTNQHQIREIGRLKEEATQLIESERRKYTKLKNTGSERDDFAWAKQIMVTGTFSDRLAANTMLIQESAIHNFQCLVKLIELVNAKGVRETMLTIDTLKDIFLAELLPTTKLKRFEESVRYITMKKDQDEYQRQLILFIFEDQVKEQYKQFLVLLQKIANDAVHPCKDRAVDTMYELLCSKPEQEQFLLEQLVNKIGDPVPKRATHIISLLVKLVNIKHPLMKEIVAKEVERILYKTNIQQKTKFYALNFLSQISLGKDDKELAQRLIKIFFGFFEAQIKKTTVNNKLMNILLAGVSRVFPFAGFEDETMDEKLDNFYRAVHMVEPNTAIQALQLIFNVNYTKTSGLLTDRYYTCLYRSLVEIRVERCTKKKIFINLLYKSLKCDPFPKRIRAFLKRTLSIALNQPSSFIAAYLIMISTLLDDKKDLVLNRPIVKTVDGSEDEDEHYVDADKVNEENPEQVEPEKMKKTKKELKKEKKKKDPPQVVNVKMNVKQRSVVKISNNEKETNNKSRTDEYDSHHRNPLYANADTVENWELVLMCHHSHPSVALFAKNLVMGQKFRYDGDPMADFTNRHFLDRFVYRNPKKINPEKAKQVRRQTLFGRRRKRKEISIKDMANRPEKSIPVEELFIYNYIKARDKKSLDDDEEIESVTSDDFDRFLERFEPDEDEEYDFDEPAKKKKKSKGKRADEKKSKSKQTEDGSDDEFAGEVDFSDDGMDDFDDDDLDDEEIDYELDDDDMVEDFDDEDDDDEEGEYDGILEDEVTDEMHSKFAKMDHYSDGDDEDDDFVDGNLDDLL